MRSIRDNVLARLIVLFLVTGAMLAPVFSVAYYVMLNTPPDLPEIVFVAPAAPRWWNDDVVALHMQFDVRDPYTCDTSPKTRVCRLGYIVYVLNRKVTK